MELNTNPTLQEVIDKLKTVGDADQIALFFEEQGVQGVCGASTRCAIAEYVKMQTGEPWAGVGGVVQVGTVLHREGSSWEIRTSQTADLSPSLHCFMMKFDDGDYPNLIKKESDV